MPQSHPEPAKNKSKNARQRKTAAKQRTQREAASATKDHDTHRESAGQRAAWEGMTAKTPQTTRAVAANDTGDEFDEKEIDDADTLEGEGSYVATRQYNRGVAASLAKGKVDERAQAAKRAIEGPEANVLRRAERIGKAGHPKRSG